MKGWVSGGGGGRLGGRNPFWLQVVEGCTPAVQVNTTDRGHGDGASWMCEITNIMNSETVFIYHTIIYLHNTFPFISTVRVKHGKVLSPS